MKSMESRLSALGRKLDDIQLNAAASGEKARLELADWKLEMQRKMSEMRERLDQAKTGGNEAWDDMKEGVQASLEEIEKAFKQARSRFGS